MAGDNEREAVGGKVRHWLLYVLGGVLLVGLVALIAWPKDNGVPVNSTATTLPEPDIANAAEATAVQDIPSGTFAEWSGEKYPEPVTFRSGEITIAVTVEPETDELIAPVFRINAPGMREHVLKGEATSRSVDHRIGVGRLNPQARIDHVILASYSGGAHCCTNVQVAAPAGDGFTTIDLGEWDGDGIAEFPKDISGDGVADFIFSDNAFLYAFASYAESAAPPVILNVIGTRLANVSKAAAFRPVYAKFVDDMRPGCLSPDDMSPNGACAAYVAAAARIGRFQQAWRDMLGAYDPNQEWDLPTGCRVAAKGVCPEGQSIAYATYPEALYQFLIETGYVPAGSLPPAPPPSAEGEAGDPDEG